MKWHAFVEPRRDRSCHLAFLVAPRGMPSVFGAIGTGACVR
jgi:hypothetical protein